MAELNLGPATDWDDGEPNGKVKLVENRVYPGSPERNVAVISPTAWRS